MGPQFVDHLLRAHGPRNVIGASPQQLATLEAELGVAPPPSLRRYLEHVGDVASELLAGTDLGIAGIAVRTQDAAALLREQNLTLDSDAIVFASHQGYDFAWVRASLGDASPVYGYVEGASAIEERFPSFGLWLGWALQQR